MNEPVTPTSTNRTEAGSCCGSAPANAAEVAPAQSSPCCGTSESAEAAGTCCAPQAKSEAVATGADCC
ncbi:hypothetical protein [Streptomyces avidinii]|uniref:Uncharacterized protein n=1 Tax=Streptomyces avidinii TaxID=1895 RepID=A0ABS4LFF9_STRAV|nr:hypothetical protein [Streptomyces avidinii]MBP2040869.1 hypothetical protein [Streptomyces avidinii]GGZ06269.1 hypothetical protein GCM10010343_35260 [Streptomyces avidinii]